MDRSGLVVRIIAFINNHSSSNMAEIQFLKSNSVWYGWEPWSSGYGRRLMFKRSWVRDHTLDGNFFTLICCKIVLFV